MDPNAGQKLDTKILNILRRVEPVVGCPNVTSPKLFLGEAEARASDASGGGRVTEANQVSSARPPTADIGLTASSATSPSCAGGGDLHCTISCVGEVTNRLKQLD